MAIRLSCPDCATCHDLEDDQAGTQITCTGCQAPLAVPAPRASRPAGRPGAPAPVKRATPTPEKRVTPTPPAKQAPAPAPRPEARVTPARPQTPARARSTAAPARPATGQGPGKKGSILPLLIGLGVGLAFLLLLGCGGTAAAVYYFWYDSSSSSSPSVASASPKTEKMWPSSRTTQDTKGTDTSARQPMDPITPPVVTPPVVTPPVVTPPVVTPPVTPPPVVTPPVVTPVPVDPRADPVDPRTDPPRPTDPRPVNPRPVDPRPADPRPMDPRPTNPVVAWQVQLDPVPEALKLPENPRISVVIASPFNPVVFPSTPSPFVAVAGGQLNARELRDVYDLRNGQRVGGPPIKHLNEVVLSPDGTALATKVAGEKPTIEVWSVADNQSVKLVFGDGSPFPPQIDFAAPGKLLTIRTVGVFEPDFHVWDIKTGKEVCQFKAAVMGDARQRALSGGRRYLAVVRRNNEGVVLYDLTTGKPAGELPVPVLPANTQFQGLAFSPDGRSLAGLLVTGGQGARLVVWDLTTGKQSVVHTFDKDPQQNPFGYPGPAIEWLPDGGWVLHGSLFVDNVSGRIYWRVPVDGADSTLRRALAPDKIVRMKSGSLIVDVLPAERLAAAREAVRSGQDPTATLLPPAKKADWASVKVVNTNGFVPWTAGPDPALPTRAPFTSRPIPLRGRAMELMHILFAGPDVGQAAVLTGVASDDMLERRQVRVHRYDLVSGKDLGSIDLFAVETPVGRGVVTTADFSPDGTLVAVCEPKNGRRVDIWSFTTGKHQVGWLPCEKDTDGKIRWMAFVDSTRLLTLTSTDKLTLWDISTCRAVYTLPVRYTPALSPGRKYLTVFTDSGAEVLQSATGERAGKPAGDLTNLRAVSYRRDGTEMVGLDGNSTLIRWDATTGVRKDEYKPDVTFPVMSVEWYGTDSVLMGDTVYNLAVKWPISTITTTSMRPTGSPDGRYWFTHVLNFNDPPELMAQTLPTAAMQQAAKQIANGQIAYLLPPDAVVTVRVEGAGPVNQPDEFRAALATQINARLKQERIQVGPDGNTTLVVKLGQRETGEVRKVMVTLPKRMTVDVKVLEVVIDTKVMDNKGTVLWSKKESVQTPLVGLVRAEDPVPELTKGLWAQVSPRASLMTPPRGVVRTPTGTEPWPPRITPGGDR